LLSPIVGWFTCTADAGTSVPRQFFCQVASLTYSRIKHGFSQNNMIETTQVIINRKAIISFISGLLALLVICTGVLPIPFAFILCYPVGIIFGVLSIVLGIKAQREIRETDESGLALARLAIWISGFALFAYVCMLTAGALLLPRVAEYISRFIN
jgi:hypothetical protein